MIRLYLRDLINDHKPTTESNNKENDSSSDRGELKIQLVMQNSCTYTKNFEEICTIYSASEPVEIFMGSDTEDLIDKLFNAILQRFQQAQETPNDKGREFIPERIEFLYYYFHKINIIRAESYIMSSNWIINKKSNNKPKKWKR